MIRHAVLVHPEVHPHEVEFRMTTVSQHKTAFERQIAEAVAIDRERKLGTTLLNSKGEYNRCVIHKLDTRSEVMILT